MTEKKDIRYKVIGSRARARARYAMILSRVKNSHLERNSCYQGVEVRVARDEFISWFMERDFKGCSVDRIDPSGHYELSNMQIISCLENQAKDRLKVVDGKKWCRICQAYVPFSEMVKSSRAKYLGLDSICKPCERIRTTDRYHKNQDRRPAQ